MTGSINLRLELLLPIYDYGFISRLKLIQPLDKPPNPPRVSPVTSLTCLYYLGVKVLIESHISNDAGNVALDLDAVCCRGNAEFHQELQTSQFHDLFTMTGHLSRE